MDAKHQVIIERARESLLELLELPALVVLALIYLLGLGVMALCVWTLYSYWLMLQAVAGT
jgi:hypothetical protein